MSGVHASRSPPQYSPVCICSSPYPLLRSVMFAFGRSIESALSFCVAQRSELFDLGHSFYLLHPHGVAVVVVVVVLIVELLLPPAVYRFGCIRPCCLTVNGSPLCSRSIGSRAVELVDIAACVCVCICAVCPLPFCGFVLVCSPPADDGLDFDCVCVCVNVNSIFQST